MNMIENNKLIAEFMGYEKHPRITDALINKTKKMLVPYWSDRNNEVLLDDLAYNQSYDWLMPVVERIENTFQVGTGDLCKVYISSNNNPKDKFYYCNIFGSEDAQFNGESKQSKIESVYRAVVEFIKWYNLNK